MPKGTQTPPGKLTLEIAGTLRAELARQKMTTTALAQAASLSRPQVSKMLAGTKPLDVEELDRLLYVLGLPIAKVVTDADTATPLRHG